MQQGSGIKRKAGRPVGSKTRNFLNVRGESMKIRRLAALRDAGIRARRSKPQTVSFDELEPKQPQPELSYGRKRAVTRYQVPAARGKKQKKPFLSGRAKTNLKRAGVVAASVGGAALAAALAAKYRRPREASEAPADDGADFEFEDGAPTPPPRDYSTPVTPDAFRQFRDLLDADQEVGRPGRFAGDRSITPERSPGRSLEARRQRLEDLRAERLQRDAERGGPALELDGFDYGEEALGPELPRTPSLAERRARRKAAGKNRYAPDQRDDYDGEGGSLVQQLSPCDQMKDTCRTVMALAERGDKKGAKKEMKQLREHLRETRDYIMAL